MSLKLKGDFRANTTPLPLAGGFFFQVLCPEPNSVRSINFVLNVEQNLEINCQ